SQQDEDKDIPVDETEPKKDGVVSQEDSQQDEDKDIPVDETEPKKDGVVSQEDSQQDEDRDIPVEETEPETEFTTEEEPPKKEISIIDINLESEVVSSIDLDDDVEEEPFLETGSDFLHEPEIQQEPEVQQNPEIPVEKAPLLPEREKTPEEHAHNDGPEHDDLSVSYDEHEPYNRPLVFINFDDEEAITVCENPNDAPISFLQEDSTPEEIKAVDEDASNPVITPEPPEEDEKLAFDVTDEDEELSVDVLDHDNDENVFDEELSVDVLDHDNDESVFDEELSVEVLDHDNDESVFDEEHNPVEQEQLSSEVTVPEKEDAAMEEEKIPPRVLEKLDTIVEVGTVTGDTLRQVRENRGLSLEEVAEETQIALDVLEHIEQESFEKLGDAGYLRWYISTYAKAISIDYKSAANQYMIRFRDWMKKQG
ncbi:MAG: hypothetical protein GY757_16035, partial [bacterium]|nr:hypothetical protein [bacterium]